MKNGIKKDLENKCKILSFLSRDDSPSNILLGINLAKSCGFTKKFMSDKEFDIFLRDYYKYGVDVFSLRIKNYSLFFSYPASKGYYSSWQKIYLYKIYGEGKYERRVILEEVSGRTDGKIMPYDTLVKKMIGRMFIKLIKENE